MVDLTNIYEEYKGKWIALDKKQMKVIASDNTAVGANIKAKREGARLPILFKVPVKNIPYVGFIK